MAKPKSRRARNNAAQRESVVAVEQLVTPEARRHGIYVVEQREVTEGDLEPGERGKRSMVVNRGSTTVDRWYARGALDDRQMNAIRLYRWAWHLCFSETRTTMDWDVFASVPIRGGTALGDFIANAAQAKEDIEHFDRVIFSLLPRARFDVWQNVVIFDEPAGQIGGRLGFAGRDSAATAALVNTQMICDMIAAKWRL